MKVQRTLLSPALLILGAVSGIVGTPTEAAQVLGRGVADEQGRPLAVRVMASRVESICDSETLDVEVPRAESPFLLEPIDLLGDQQIRGVVVDRKHRAVEGARVFVRLRGEHVRRTGTGSPRDQPSAVTAADGHFEIDGIDAAGAFELEVWKEGFLPARVNLPPGERGEGLELTLEPAAVVEGVVVSETGSPVAGASVSVMPAKDQKENVDRNHLGLVLHPLPR